MPADAIAAATRAAHGAGGKAAVHTQSAEGGLAAAQAGAGSIEHGMHLPAEMFDPGTAIDLRRTDAWSDPSPDPV